MIDDLDKSLEQLLKTELPPGLVSQVAITFASPGDQFPPSSVTLPALDLFLYDVRENRELRSNEWRLERLNDGAGQKNPPTLRIDCSYLITAWPSASSTTAAQDEHRLLGELLKALSRYTSLPSAVLQGVLAGQQPPLPTTSLQPGRLQSLAEFWQALGGKPKAAVHYTVTVGVDAQKPVAAGPLVTDKLLKMRLGV